MKIGDIRGTAYALDAATAHERMQTGECLPDHRNECSVQ
jgi:hypothetical protein